jgi:tetratricopeptide (TPR) repeat protein
MFDQAIKLDENFALAHAGVGHVCGMIFELREQHPRWIERGLAACERAMALDQHSAEVLAARARVYYAQKDYGQAVRYAQSAIERKADCEGAYNVLGRALFASDRSEEAAALVDRAVEVSGDDYNTFIPFINALSRLGRAEKVTAMRQRMMGALERQLELVPEDVRARILLANMLPSFGRNDDAVRQLHTAVALRPGDGNVLYNAACTYGLMSRKAEALDMFLKALEAGYGNREWAARDSDLECLHDEPEFRRLCGLGAN